MARLLLVLVLLAAQAGVLAAALFAPRVSAVHRAFYMDRTTQCWLREGQGEIPEAGVILPVALDPDSFCRLMPVGWAQLDPFGPASQGVWSQRRETEIRLPLRPGDRSVVLVMRGYAPAAGRQLLSVRLNGGAAAEEAVPHGMPRALCLPVPPGAREARIAIGVGIVTRPALAGDAHDTRGTGVEMVEIRRASGQCGQ